MGLRLPVKAAPLRVLSAAAVDPAPAAAIDGTGPGIERPIDDAGRMIRGRGATVVRVVVAADDRRSIVGAITAVDLILPRIIDDHGAAIPTPVSTGLSFGGGSERQGTEHAHHRRREDACFRHEALS